MRELNKRWIKERIKKMKRKKGREEEKRVRIEKEDRRRRERNVVWKGVVREDREEA